MPEPDGVTPTDGARAIAAAVADVINPAHESHHPAHESHAASALLEPVSPGEPIEDEVTAATEDLIEAAGEASVAVPQAAAEVFTEAKASIRDVPSEAAAFEPFKIDPAILPDKLGVEFAQASRMFTAFNAHVMDAWRSNAEAMLAHMTTLAGVRTVSEAIALNSEFARKQLESLNAQSRALADIASLTRREG